MALKDIWTNKIDGVSDIEANDINLLADHIIDLEKNSGGGGSTLTIEEVLKEVVSPTVVKDISNVVFDVGKNEEVNALVGSFNGTDRTLVDFKVVIEIDGVEKTITKDTEGLSSFSMSFQYGDDGHGNPLYIDYTSLPQQLEPYNNYLLGLMNIVYNGVQYYPANFKSIALVLKKSEKDKLATTTEVLALIKENIPPSGDEVSY